MTRPINKVVEENNEVNLDVHFQPPNIHYSIYANSSPYEIFFLNEIIIIIIIVATLMRIAYMSFPLYDSSLSG